MALESREIIAKVTRLNSSVENSYDTFRENDEVRRMMEEFKAESNAKLARVEADFRPKIPGRITQLEIEIKKEIHEAAQYSSGLRRFLEIHAITCTDKKQKTPMQQVVEHLKALKSQVPNKDQRKQEDKDFIQYVAQGLAQYLVTQKYIPPNVRDSVKHVFSDYLALQDKARRMVLLDDFLGHFGVPESDKKRISDVFNSFSDSENKNFCWSTRFKMLLANNQTAKSDPMLSAFQSSSIMDKMMYGSENNDFNELLETASSGVEMDDVKKNILGEKLEVELHDLTTEGLISESEKSIYKWVLTKETSSTCVNTILEPHKPPRSFRNRLLGRGQGSQGGNYERNSEELSLLQKLQHDGDLSLDTIKRIDVLMRQKGCASRLGDELSYYINWYDDGYQKAKRYEKEALEKRDQAGTKFVQACKEKEEGEAQLSNLIVVLATKALIRFCKEDTRRDWFSYRFSGDRFSYNFLKAKSFVESLEKKAQNKNLGEFYKYLQGEIKAADLYDQSYKREFLHQLWSSDKFNSLFKESNNINGVKYRKEKILDGRNLVDCSRWDLAGMPLSQKGNGGLSPRLKELRTWAWRKISKIRRLSAIIAPAPAPAVIVSASSGLDPTAPAAPPPMDMRFQRDLRRERPSGPWSYRLFSKQYKSKRRAVRKFTASVFEMKAAKEKDVADKKAKVESCQC